MRLGTLALLLVFATESVAAQERADRTGPRVRLSGIVRDSAGVPVADVGLRLTPGERTATTDRRGRFQFDGIGPEHITYELRARRLGFLPATYFIRMVGADTSVGLRLEKRPTLLDTIVVSGRECARNSFDGFLCRRAKAQGTYLTEADILAKNPTYLADIFRDIKGFKIEPVVTPYGPQRVVTVAPSRCIVQLVNGRPMVATGVAVPNTPSGAGGGGAVPLVPGDFLGPENLIGVEIYPPGTYAPVEYAGLATRMRQPGGVSTVRGSRFTSRRRRVQPVEERCSLINYWTPAGIRKTTPAAKASADSAKPPTR